MFIQKFECSTSTGDPQTKETSPPDLQSLSSLLSSTTTSRQMKQQSLNYMRLANSPALGCASANSKIWSSEIDLMRQVGFSHGLASFGAVPSPTFATWVSSTESSPSLPGNQPRVLSGGSFSGESGLSIPPSKSLEKNQTSPGESGSQAKKSSSCHGQCAGTPSTPNSNPLTFTRTKESISTDAETTSPCSQQTSNDGT